MPDSVPPNAARSQAPVVRMYAVVLGVGIACAVLIVAVVEATKPPIERNRIQLRQQAVFGVLPEASTTAAFRYDGSGFVTTAINDGSAGVVFAGYDDQNQLVGLALEADGQGYQDVVRIMYGYSIQQEAIIGMKVLESRETPGLGDRVETDSAFLSNFESLDVSLNSAKSELANPIEFVKPGKKESAWQIDGISGATITSKAIADMLSRDTLTAIPQVVAHQADFERKVITAESAEVQNER